MKDLVLNIALISTIVFLVYFNIIWLKYACFLRSHPGISHSAAWRLFYKLPSSPLTRWFHVGKFTYVRLEFKWQDMWIGAFLNMSPQDSALDSWFIIIPMFPFHFRKTVFND